MGKENIYKILRGGGLTHAGAIAVMGNMMAESSLKSNIAQRGMTRLSDEEYTRQADSGELEFRDSVGYGLCQWTLSSRKLNLLRWCRDKGVSVGDETAQVLFCLHELQTDFSTLWQTLTTTGNYETACDRVCDVFERPAINNYSVRRAFAAEFDYLKDGRLNGYSGAVDMNELLTPALIRNEEPSQPAATAGTQSAAPRYDGKIAALQGIMYSDGYWEKNANGIPTPEFCDCLKEYADAIKENIK